MTTRVPLNAAVCSADSRYIRRSSLSRHLTGAAAAAVIVALAFSSGGYPSSSYGVLLLLFGLVLLVTSLVADDVPIDVRSVALVGALTGLALWQLSSVLWATTATWPVLEAERGLVYAAAAAALVVSVRRERVPALAGGIVAGSTLVALWALATRLFPGWIGGPYEPAAGYQLAEPIGYWNALGLLLVFGLLLGLGIGLHSDAARRSTVGAALVPLSAALYFTFSRGAMLALLVGLAVLVALDRRALLGTPGLAAAPALGVLLAMRSPALTHAGEPLEVAQAQGERLALLLAAAAAVGATAAWRIRPVDLRLPHVKAISAAALAVLVAAAVVGLAREGGPGAVRERVLEAFEAEPPPAAGSLDRRLLSASGHGRADYWRVAAGMVGSSPLLGEGAGTFERHWTESRPAPHNARDAHNLYLETLAELGPVGLGLLLLALLAPLTGVRRARARPLVPATVAAYVAFGAHASIDWDWELPILVLPALACAAMLVAEARSGGSIPLTAPLRALGATTAVVVLGVAVVAHAGNSALAASAEALERGDPAQAAQAARRARAWMPWSHEPWQLLGEAQLATRRDLAARRSLREAIERAPEEWRSWFDLAIVSDGRTARVSITRARELNPLSPEMDDLRGR